MTAPVDPSWVAIGEIPMFYPERMTEMELVVPEQYAVAVTRTLAETGAFHQVDASYLSAQAGLGSTNDWQQKASAFAGLERRLQVVMRTLGVEEGAPSADLSTMTEIDAIRPAMETLEQQVHRVIETMTDEQRQIAQLQSSIRQLEPISDVDVEISVLRGSRYMFQMLGLIPAENVDRLQTSLARVPSVVLPLRRDNQRAVVALVGMRENADVLNRAARSAYLNPLELPEGYEGTPGEVLDALRVEVERMQQHIAEQQGVIAELRAARQEQLRSLLWRVRASRMLSEAMARYGKLRYTYVIAGWVPAVRVDALKGKLQQVSRDILMETRPTERGRSDRSVPVALKNPGPLRSFQQLVTTYGRPQYGEVDPTLFVALTFPLLFGAMFGDVGHGLVLLGLGGLLASRRVKRLRSAADLGVVVAVCGAVSIVFGLLYGSIFGLESVLSPLWIRPMENIMTILGVAIGAGVVLLSVGFLTGILNAWLARDWARLLFSHTGVAGLVLYWSLLALAASLLMPQFPLPPIAASASALIAGLAVMFSDLLGRLVRGQRPLVEESAGTYAVQVVFELFETLISLMSNSLSYVRVGAFAVAHAGLSAVVFILAEMVSPNHGVGYWLVAAIGNLFIVGFEGMIVAIQTLRLEYYEFFSKFFEGGGAPYAPLSTLGKTDR